MVAYNFQAQFVGSIESGRKTNTIRKNGKRRHVRRGEKLQLYYAQRTKQCRKILDAVCTGVDAIRIMVSAETITSIQIGGAFVPDLEAFAVADGFAGLAEMHAFWLAAYGVGLFEGTFINWGD